MIRRAVPLVLLAVALAFSPAAGDGHGDGRPIGCGFMFVGAPAIPGVSSLIADPDARTAWQFILLRCPEAEGMEVYEWSVEWLEIVSGVADTGVGGPGSVTGGVPEEEPMAAFHGVHELPQEPMEAFGADLAGGPAAVWEVMIPNLSTYTLVLCADYRADPDPDDRTQCVQWGQWH